jgi:hypothetical protein
MAITLHQNRCVEKKEEMKSINVSLIPARRAITAERSTSESSLCLFGHPWGEYNTELGWNIAKRRTEDSIYSSYEVHTGNQEKVTLGGTEITYEQRVNPHFNHRGDYYMYDLGEYSNIINTIDIITGYAVENEKFLAKLMLEYSRTGKAINAGDLETAEIKLNATPSNVHALNRILYHCFVKEIARWQLPKQADTHELPWATAQFRAVKLIAMGHLRMRDVFAQYAPYGVFTGKEIGKNIESVREKMKAINRLYIEACLKQKSDQFSKHIAFFKDHKKGEFITTRQQLHADLREGYGGESDTDGEGYDSETAIQDTVHCAR